MEKQLLSFTGDGFLLGDKPFFLASGDMHYFRFVKGGWQRRLQLMKDFGLTCVQTYVPWNLHEPEEGQFCFEDNLDLSAFLSLCQQIGLKVLLRPCPYICSEWEFGGLPYWLLNKENICIRTSDPVYLQCLTRYYETLCPMFVPFLSTNGGPIIAVAVENEYGSFSNDQQYMYAVGELLRQNGVDVPLYTANGCEPYKLQVGSRKEYFTAIDLHVLNKAAYESITAYQPGKPILAAEFWAGKSLLLGGVFNRQPSEAAAENYKNLLAQGAFVNIYMFCGGSNFGFMNGALYGNYHKAGIVEGYPFGHPEGLKYIPFTQSYDTDAPVSESGAPTEKYYRMKLILKEHMEKLGLEFPGTDSFAPSDLPRTQTIPSVTVTHCGDVLDSAHNLCTKAVHSQKPLTFENMGQAYGFMLYSTHLPYHSDEKMQLVIHGLKDYACVFANGNYIGTQMRDRICPPMYFTIPSEGTRIDILVENCGRINYGLEMLFENKGITKCVKAETLKPDGSFVHNFSFLASWENRSLPMTAQIVENAVLTGTAKNNRPAIYKGNFEAIPGVDTYIRLEGLNKGAIYINGFHLGRFWSAGSQQALYVPGELLKEHNAITLLELYGGSETLQIHFDSKPWLDGKKGVAVYSAIHNTDKREQIG